MKNPNNGIDCIRMSKFTDVLRGLKQYAKLKIKCTLKYFIDNKVETVLVTLRKI